VLTLIQTGKSRPRPILLFGAAFWKRLIDFDLLIDSGMIAPEDVNLFKFVETAEEGWAALKGAYGFEGIEGVPTLANGEI
jgi:predicted Rossmann-fold nucleotide-binding protein